MSLWKYFQPSSTLPKPEGHLSTVMPSSSIAAANKEVLDKTWKEFKAWSVWTLYSSRHGSHKWWSLQCRCSSGGLFTILLIVLLPADDCGCGHRWSACAHAQSIVTPMQDHRSMKGFSAKSYISLIRESFLPRKFPTIRYLAIISHFGCCLT